MVKEAARHEGGVAPEKVTGAQFLPNNALMSTGALKEEPTRNAAEDLIKSLTEQMNQP